MVLLDVNVVVNAMRSDALRHVLVNKYVEALRKAPEPFGVCDLVLSGALRVRTHPRVFNPPHRRRRRRPTSSLCVQHPMRSSSRPVIGTGRYSRICSNSPE